MYFLWYPKLMSREILTPFSYSDAVELSGSGRPRYRKQIMKIETIKYTDASGTRLIRFDQPYMQKLVEAFNSGAYDQVPFQIADGQNAHNNDPERFRGDLVGVELTQDGIDGIFEPTPDGERLVQTNPKLGVSCRIVEDPDSPHKIAIQHVLGTVNPKLRGMRPWEKVDLSADSDVEQTTDLSVEQDEEEEMPKTVVLELSEERAERLTTLLDDMDAADALAGLLEDSDEEDENGPDDEDENEGTDDGDGTDEEGRPVDSEQVALLMARQDHNEQRIIELTQQLRTSNVRSELDLLAREGLAPAIIKAAQPMLGVPSGAVELSQPDGSRVDPAEVMRDVLRTVLELAQSGQAVVDLDAETGWAGPETDSATSAREALVDAWEKQSGRR